MALTKEEMRRKLQELSENDRDGLAGVLEEGLEERRKAEGLSKAERLLTDLLGSSRPN